MRVRRRIVPVGAAGAAAKTVSFGSPEGYLEGIAINYEAQPSTIDIIIRRTLASANVVEDILTLTSSNTDGVFYPRVLAGGPTGVALEYGDDTAAFNVPVGVYLDGETKVYAVIAQGNPTVMYIDLLVRPSAG